MYRKEFFTYMQGKIRKNKQVLIFPKNNKICCTIIRQVKVCKQTREHLKLGALSRNWSITKINKVWCSHTNVGKESNAQYIHASRWQVSKYQAGSTRKLWKNNRLVFIHIHVPSLRLVRFLGLAKIHLNQIRIKSHLSVTKNVQ